MKKGFKYFAAVWAVLFVLFQVIAFVSPGWTDVEKYTGSFWCGYVFITLCFAGQLACAWFALKDGRGHKTFYNMSLFTTCYGGLIVSFIFGGLCMLLSLLPYWAAILVCVIILAAQVLAVAKTVAAIEIVSNVDQKVKVKTFFVKSLTVDAESLLMSVSDDEVKQQCKKVYEAVRWSDPVSHDALSSLETTITLKFNAFSSAAKTGDREAVSELAKELLVLLSDRNNKCKLLK